MHLALEEDLPNFTDIQWILGGLGISIMAFLLGCITCWQRKEPVIATRRPAPPTPEPGSLSQYPTGPLSATVHQISETDADDYEEDFEVPAPRKEPPKSKQSSPSPRKSTTETNSHSSYVNIGFDPEPSYENVDNSASNNFRPIKDHTYLELIATGETTKETDLTAANTTMSTDVEINSWSENRKSMSIPESPSNGYENVVLHSPPTNSELNQDYVNMSGE